MGVHSPEFLQALGVQYAKFKDLPGSASYWEDPEGENYQALMRQVKSMSTPDVDMLAAATYENGYNIIFAAYGHISDQLLKAPTAKEIAEERAKRLEERDREAGRRSNNQIAYEETETAFRQRKLKEQREQTEAAAKATKEAADAPSVDLFAILPTWQEILAGGCIEMPVADQNKLDPPGTGASVMKEYRTRLHRAVAERNAAQGKNRTQKV